MRPILNFSREYRGEYRALAICMHNELRLGGVPIVPLIRLIGIDA